MAIILSVAFGLCYVICKLLIQGDAINLYTTEWATRHFFLGAWILVIIFSLLIKRIAALSVFISCFFGILLGEVVGTLIKTQNLQRLDQLTAEGASAEAIQRLYHHHGVTIWIATMLIGCIIGLMLDKYGHSGKNKRKDS